MLPVHLPLVVVLMRADVLVLAQDSGGAGLWGTGLVDFLDHTPLVRGKPQKIY